MKISSLILFIPLFINSAAAYSKENISKYDDASKLIDVWFEAQKGNPPIFNGVQK